MSDLSGDKSQEQGMSLILVFDRLPDLSKVMFADHLPRIEPLDGAVRTKMDIQGEDATAGGVLHTIVSFGDHEVQMAGFSFPAPPDVVEHTVRVSNWSQEAKPPLFNHKAHILAFYRGTNRNPVEQMVALYKVAHCFQAQGLIGVLDTDGWNCMPAAFIGKMLESQMLKTCRESIPLGIWAGYVKLFKAQDEIWFCTKGLWRFGANDMAFLGRLSDSDFVFDTFDDLFRYMRSGAVLRTGHTAQVGDAYLKFRAPYEYADFLESPGGTLVIEKIRGSEINQPRP
jgi:hypothetical protein